MSGLFIEQGQLLFLDDAALWIRAGWPGFRHPAQILHLFGVGGRLVWCGRDWHVAAFVQGEVLAVWADAGGSEHGFKPAGRNARHMSKADQRPSQDNRNSQVVSLDDSRIPRRPHGLVAFAERP